MKYSKQQFEEEVYSVVTANINAFFKEILEGDKSTFHQDILYMLRDFMEIMHVVTTESIVQIFYGVKLFNEAEEIKKEVH